MTAPARPAPVESVDVGDIRITYLPDGDASVSAEAVFPTGSAELWEAHRELFEWSARRVSITC
jgi:hypothetical protein